MLTQRKEQEVWQACDDLLAMGKTPREITGEAIGNRLRELGFKPGSLTYRYRYRDSWMEARGLSRELGAPSDAVATDIIDRSAAIFRQSIEAGIRQEYEKNLALRDTQIHDLLATQAAATLHIQDLSEERNRITSQLHNLQAAHQSLENTTRAQQQAYSVLEERLRLESAHFAQKTQDFESERQTLQQDHQASMAALQTLANSQREQAAGDLAEARTLMEAQRHSALVKMDALWVEKEALVRELATAQAQVRQGIQALETANIAAKALQERLEASLSAKQTLEAEFQGQAQSLAKLQGQVEAYAPYIADLQQQRVERQAALEAAQSTLGQQGVALAQAQAEILNLSQALALEVAKHSTKAPA